MICIKVSKQAKAIFEALISYLYGRITPDELNVVFLTNPRYLSGINSTTLNFVQSICETFIKQELLDKKEKIFSNLSKKSFFKEDYLTRDIVKNIYLDTKSTRTLAMTCKYYLGFFKYESCHPGILKLLDVVNDYRKQHIIRTVPIEYHELNTAFIHDIRKKSGGL